MIIKFRNGNFWTFMKKIPIFEREKNMGYIKWFQQSWSLQDTGGHSGEGRRGSGGHGGIWLCENTLLWLHGDIKKGGKDP